MKFDCGLTGLGSIGVVVGMEDKLTRMQDLLEKICEIRDSSPSSFTQSLEVQAFAEDIIHVSIHSLLILFCST